MYFRDGFGTLNKGGEPDRCGNEGCFMLERVVRSKTVDK